MEFEWDEGKSDDNCERHGISFADAVCVFDGLMVRHKNDRRDDGEIRFKDTGTLDGNIVAVIYTMREARCRLISVRRANRGERRFHYEKSS